MNKKETRLKERIPEIKEAKEVTIELDDSYLTSTPKKRYVIQEKHFNSNYENILRTITRKIKYYFMLWRPIEVGDIGLISSQLLEDVIRVFPHDIKFRVAFTRPKGEVQITPNTKITLRFSEIVK